MIPIVIIVNVINYNLHITTIKDWTTTIIVIEDYMIIMKVGFIFWHKREKFRLILFPFILIA